MQRIAIIGSGGAGKSTLAARLGKILHLPVIHLDRLHWRPGWVEPPKDEWKRKVEEIVSTDRWIIDGNYGGTMEIRFAACDTVIYLDFPRAICTWRVIKRRFKYRSGTRPDMDEGCPEKLDLEFVSWIWNFPSKTRPRIEERLSGLSADKRLIRLTSPAAVRSFLRETEPANLQTI
jgi:adenylate kinase family enzyme